MITSILGTKIGQSQQFTADGKRIPVTFVAAGPCWVTQMNDKSLQLGFGIAKHMNKAQVGHIKKAGLEQKPRFLREIRVSDLSNVSDLRLGQEIKVGEVFTPGDAVRVTGVSKGKGFAGVVRRHQFAGGPKTHGQSDRWRSPGAIGAGTTPGRVYRGKRMAGRMGGERVTVSGLTVVGVDPEKNILTIKGVVPGAKNGLLIIQKE
ncbi:50S ribosomal protein L3 [Candidatus Gottesmanbacteria bacterium]|nr:50S ribosomal protein L3 [Candidatus Gottesmanbacteria bacterium]